MKNTVNKMAGMAGISVRTLQYYDKIGLLTPSARSESGYRLYDSEDIKRLQQILFYRELDFALEDIGAILNASDFDRQQALIQQAQLLERKAERYLNLSDLARKTIRNLKGEIQMEDKQFLNAFDVDKMLEEQKQYEDEVSQRWGNSDAWKESKRRTKGYTKEDWERISVIQANNLKELTDLYQSGISHDDPQVQACVENARLFINDNFYPCTPEFMGNLGEMYISDPRFTAFYEKFAPGLAEYYNDAIQYYCHK